MKVRLSALILSAVSILSAPALAADSDPAQAFFDRGIEDLEAGRFDRACPSIEQSYKLDPRPGTLFTLAECEAKRGRVATASQRYEEYLALYATLSVEKRAKQGDREKDSRASLAALLPQVPRVTVSLPPNASRDTVVMRDGVRVTNLSSPLPVDPGDHVFTARAPGAPPVERRVTVGRGEKKVVILDLASSTTVPSGPPPVADVAQGPSGRRVGAYVAGGVGVVGLLIGAITGGMAIAKKSTVDHNCGANAGFPTDPTACNHTGKTAADSLATLGLTSTVGLVVGGAGLVTGVVLFVTEPKAPAAAVGLRGVW